MSINPKYPSASKSGKVHTSREELCRAVDHKLRQMNLHGGKEAFDPVVLLAMIACESYDAKDLALSVTAAKEVAKYMRPQLKSVEVVAEVEHTTSDVEGAKMKLANMLGIDPVSGEKTPERLKRERAEAELH